MALGKKVITLDALPEKVNKFMEDCDSKLESCESASEINQVYRWAQNKVAILQHKCRLEEDMALLSDLRTYLRSIRTARFAAKSRY